MALSNEVKLLLKLEAKEALGSVARLQYAASKVSNTVVQTQMKAYGDKVGETAATIVARALDSSNKGFAKILTESTNKAAQALEQRIKLAAGAQNDPAAQAKHMRDARSQMAAFENLGGKDVQEQLTKSWRSAVLNPTTGREITSSLADSFQRAFNDIDLNDLIGGGIKGIGGKVSEGFKASAENRKGLQTAALAAGDAEGAAAMGASAVAMSALAVAVASIAAALALAFAWMVAADDYQKKLNKTILDGAGNADIFGKSFESGKQTTLNLTNTLHAARKAAAETAVQFNLTADDTARVLSELNQAGVTYKRIMDGAESAGVAQYKFSEAIRKTISYASLLGVSTSELSQYQNTLMKDVNMSLDHTYDVFGMINEASKTSSMSQKSFFTAISQATSGMALYNVRVEEAIGFIKDFGKIVGETDAGKLVGNLTKPGTPEGNLKKATTAAAGIGIGPLGNIFKDATATAVEDFYTNFNAKAGSIKKVFEDAGQGALGGMLMSADKADREKGAKKLESLSGDDRAAIRTRLTTFDPAVNRRFENMAELGVGAGSTDIKTMAGVMDNLSAASKMLMIHAELGVLKKEGVKTADVQTNATFQAFLGALIPEMSGEDQKGMLAIAINQEQILKLVKDQQASKGTDSGVAALRAYGLVVDGTGDTSVTSKSGDLIENMADLLAATSDFGALSAPQGEAAGAAMKQQENSITNALNAWVKGEVFDTALGNAGFLQQILGFVSEKPIDPAKLQKQQEEKAATLATAVERETAAKEKLNEATTAARGVEAGSPLANAQAAAQKDYDKATAGVARATVGAQIQPGRPYTLTDIADMLKNAGGEGKGGTLITSADTEYQKYLRLNDSLASVSVLGRNDTTLSTENKSLGLSEGWLTQEATGTVVHHRALRERRDKAKSAAEAAVAAATGQQVTASPGESGQSTYTAVQDSLITANGEMYRPASDDNILTFKDGGPLDPTRGGGGGPVTININGGDQAMVYRTVTRALQAQGAR